MNGSSMKSRRSDLLMDLFDTGKTFQTMILEIIEDDDFIVEVEGVRKLIEVNPISNYKNIIDILGKHKGVDDYIITSDIFEEQQEIKIKFIDTELAMDIIVEVINEMIDWIGYICKENDSAVLIQIVVKNNEVEMNIGIKDDIQISLLELRRKGNA